MQARGFVRTLIAMMMAIPLALAPTTARAQDGPSLATDREDYLPGETVVLIGSGFQPGETVDVSIAIDDDANNVHIGDYDWMVELADDSGDFISFWTVPIEAFGMTLRASALGLTSGLVATTTFYDNHGTHNINFRVVGMEGMTPADNFVLIVQRPSPVSPHPVINNTFYLVSTTGTTSLDLGAAAQTGNVLYAGFPASYTRPNGVYYLQSTIPPSGFTPGLSGESTTVVATYQFVPNCTATNQPPTIGAVDVNLGDICPQDGTLTVTVSPADFGPVTGDPNGDPVSVAFADGSTSQTLTFSPSVTQQTLILRVTDNPSARNQVNCPALPSLSADAVVRVSANVFNQPTNEAPAVSASGIDLGNQCVGESITIPVSLGDFNAVAADPENDPFTLSLGGVTQVTLSLPPNTNDAVVSVPVVISATDDPSARNCGVCSPVGPMTGTTTVYVTANLHRNAAPVLSAGDMSLGDVLGTLSGGQFIKTVSVSPASFGAVATDPEGDPVSITSSVSNVTLVGPGVATATVTLTATDDPSARTGGSCAPASSSMSVSVNARLTYRFGGVQFPLDPCRSIKVKRGSIIPVRFRLFDANNVEVRTVPVNPAGGPTSHTISVAFNQANAPDGAVDIDELACGGEDNFEFHYLLGAWNFLLWTNNSYQHNTTYIIRIYTNDGSLNTAMISIKR